MNGLIRTLTTGLLAVAVAGGPLGRLFRQYEYEEEMYLSLDGTATVYVNGSVPALDALRGATFDPDPISRLDLASIREYFTTPVTQATWKGVQGDPNASLTPTAASIFMLFGMQTDPGYVKTNQVLATYRLALQNRSIQVGPPPYANCP